MVENCRQIIGSHAPIIDWAETAQLQEHNTMFTFDTEAFPASMSGWEVMVFVCWTLSSVQSEISTPLSQALSNFL